MAMPDGYIVVAPSNDTYMPGVSQYDMVFAVSSNIQGFAFGGSNMYMQIASNGQINVGGSILPFSNIAYDLGSSNLRFRDMYLSGNTIDIGGVRLSKDSFGSIKVTDSNGSNAGIVASQVLIGTNSNSLVTLQLDSNNSLQFVSASVSNGVVIVSSNATVVGGGGGGGGGGSNGGGWTAAGTSVYVGPGSNVGIGVTTPQAGLHVASNLRVDGNIAFTGFEVVPGTAANGFVQNSNQWFSMSSNVYITGSNVAVGKTTAAYPLDVLGDVNFSGILRQGGVPYVGSQWSNVTSNVFLLGSNVGIGVSNAKAMLHVACNLQVDGSLVLANYTMFGGIDLISGSNPMSNSSGVVLSANGIQGYSNVVWGASGSNGTMFSIMSNTVNDSWRWVSGAGSNEVARLTGNGRLGVGVAAPAYTLDVGGDLNFSGNLRQGGALYVGSQWSNSGANVFLLGSNVGLGKNNPAYPLDVNGDINFSGTLRQGGAPYVGSQWSNVGSNVFLLGSNVAIGKSNATSALDVAGSVTISSNLVFGGAIAMQGLNIQKNTGTLANITSTTVTGLSNDALGTVFSIPNNTSANYFRYVANTTEVCRITGNGNVGIRVASPAEALSVQGSFSLSNTGSKVVCSVDSSNNLNIAASNLLLGSVASNTVGNVCAGNMGLRNRVYNGDMKISTTLPTGVANTSNGIACDGWPWGIGANTGGAITASQNTLTTSDAPFSSGFKYSSKFVASTAVTYSGNYYLIISQNILVNKIVDFGWGGSSTGKTATLSLWFKSSATGNYNVNILLNPDGFSRQSYNAQITVASANTWQFYSLTIPPPSGTGAAWNTNNDAHAIRLAIGHIVTGVTGALGWSTPGSQVESGATYVNWPLTLNNYVEFTGVQLEPGNTPTPFEIRMQPMESMMNQNLVLGSVANNTVGNLCAGNMGMFRNRIINGDMRIDQRNGGALYTSGTNFFRADRFVLTEYAGDFSSQIVTDIVPTGFNTALKLTSLVTRSPASGAYWWLNQGVEANNLTDIAIGTPLTVSFWVRSSITGNLCVAVRMTNSYVQNVAINVANVWEYKTFTFLSEKAFTPSNAAGIYLGFVLNAFTLSTSGQWFSSSQPGATGMTIFTTAGTTLHFTGLQLEKGSFATPFEFRPYPIELQLCQRYYCLVGKGNYANIGVGACANATTSAYGPWKPPVPMRAVPVGTTYGTFQIMGNAGMTFSSATVSPSPTSSAENFQINYTGTNMVIGSTYIFQTANNVTSYMDFNAEL